MSLVSSGGPLDLGELGGDSYRGSHLGPTIFTPRNAKQTSVNTLTDSFSRVGQVTGVVICIYNLFARCHEIQ